MLFQTVTLSELLSNFGGELHQAKKQTSAPNEVKLSGFASLASSKSCNLSFLSNSKLKTQVLHSRAAVVLITQNDLNTLLELNFENQFGPEYFWVVKNPYLSYAKIQTWWVSKSRTDSKPYVHSTAVVDTTAKIDPTATVGPCAVIGANCVIGKNVQIGAGTVISSNVFVGNNSNIYPNVSIYHDSIIGNHCILHSGAVIGADGFGFAKEGQSWVKIPQVGKVVVADHVEIGANTTIDRGALDDTLIGFGVKLDNQIMIAHNSTIGPHTAVAGCVGMAGSTHIGAQCTIGGAAMLLGHLNIPDGTHITGATAIMSSIQKPGAYTGIFPATEHKSWEKNAVLVKQLTKLRQRVLDLEKKLLK